MADYIKRIRTQSGDKQIDYASLANLPVSDPTLLVSGAFADAAAVGEALKKKVAMPTTADGTVVNGNAGQMLVTNGDGSTAWVSIPELDTDENGNPVWGAGSTLVEIDVDKTLAVEGAAADSKAVGDKFAEVAGEIDIERKRIDTLASYHAEGGVTTKAEAELVDIRTGADGVTYDNAGTAVRSQLNKKVNIPVAEGVAVIGNAGQVLATNGDGTTAWITLPEFTINEETGKVEFGAGSVATDSDLSTPGTAADAGAVGKALESKVSLPTDPETGEVIAPTADNQVVVNNADGTTSWVTLPEFTTDEEGNVVIPNSAIQTDSDLTTEGAAADAAAVGEALKAVGETVDLKLNAPVDETGAIKNGDAGQMLVTNGDGTTGWVSVPAIETDEAGNPVWAMGLPTLTEDGVLVF